jgi:hypothetical protein
VEGGFIAAVKAGFGVGAAKWAGLRCASEEEGVCGASVRRALGIASVGEDFGEDAGSPAGVPRLWERGEVPLRRWTCYLPPRGRASGGRRRREERGLPR